MIKWPLAHVGERAHKDACSAFVGGIEFDQPPRNVGPCPKIRAPPVRRIEFGLEQRAAPLDKAGPLAEQPVIEGHPDAAEAGLRDHFAIGDDLRRRNLISTYQPRRKRS